MQILWQHWIIFLLVLLAGYYVGRNKPLGLPVIG